MNWKVFSGGTDGFTVGALGFGKGTHGYVVGTVGFAIGTVGLVRFLPIFRFLQNLLSKKVGRLKKIEKIPNFTIDKQPLLYYNNIRR